jgi:hypothetical protein
MTGQALPAYASKRAQQVREIATRQGWDWKQYREAVTRSLRDGEQAALASAANPPADGTAVVWIGFGNAKLDQYLRVGPIPFFGAEITPKELMHGSAKLNHPDFEAAWELTTDTVEMLKPVRVDHYVLARIELTGARAVTSGRRRSRRRPGHRQRWQRAMDRAPKRQVEGNGAAIGVFTLAINYLDQAPQMRRQSTSARADEDPAGVL